MKLIKTIRIKLDIDPSLVKPTMEAYSKAFNYICQIGFAKRNSNGISLHKLCYESTREYLPSQLACSARAKATEALASVFKLAKKSKKYLSCPKSKSKMSIRLDRNSYTLFLKRNEVSFSTISGRQKCKFIVPEIFKIYFDSWKYTSADLCLKKNKVFLHITFEKDLTDISTNGEIVGIDRGINNLAVVSTAKFYGGKKVKQISNKYRRLRARLQKKGTKSAKRHLVRVSRREKRFKADVNHCISKQIISVLSEGTTIVLEDLTGIRNKRLRKEQNILINNWSFFQLEQFLVYKGLPKGIAVEYIDARYTSQRCNKCGHICKSNRKTQSDFRCKKCGFTLNADLNAARNICVKHLEKLKASQEGYVNEPWSPSTPLLEQSSSKNVSNAVKVEIQAPTKALS